MVILYVYEGFVTKTLITGGAGFIGSHLSEFLIDQGDSVVAFDNLVTGKQHNVQHLLGRSGFELIEGDILDKSDLTPLVKQADRIFHLAAAVGVKLVVEKPLETLTNNTRGTENVLSLAHQLGNKTVILASTSEVYGNSPNTPFSEDDDLTIGCPETARWGYACSKLYDEFLALGYYSENKLPIIIVRLFNTVGPRQSAQYGMVIPRLVRQAMRGDPLTIYGDGNQSRCFTHVYDVVKALADLARLPEATGQIFNIGSERSITISRLGEAVRDIIGSTSEIKYIPYSEAYPIGFEDVIHRSPDITKIKKYIEYDPVFDLEDIIKDTARELNSTELDQI